ncbi:glycoside hydrolase family 99-like domain-containing protein [Clostridium saccharoperbutylacetonicum]|uniref:glycoside hydrolase family 99-like domain-containing protein n=1 Tax=Clostridium saccharoperbutylacetonicum TaxID=36745 RepID=UPI0039EB72A8
MNSKIIAFYLPQFHCIEENNKWWGSGFTEWTNTKKAKPLYKGHNQPKEPLNNRYYCLLDKKMQEWQCNLADKYGIYGFCYYHYWFSGKMLLQKPMENMLNNKNIKLPFCISWANEPWTRNWDGRDKEILISQEYGEEEDWEKHLQYLLPFFKDARYIKKDNKPIFILYRACHIKKCYEMVEYWRKRLIQYEFSGIYIIETLTGHQKTFCLNNSSAQLEMEPMHTIRHHLPLWKQGIRFIIKKLNKNGLNVYDKISYALIWNRIINKNRSYKKTTYLGGFVDWDNSPRWGRRAMIVIGANPDKFRKYFSIQYNLSNQANNEYIFINAWNEWGEGTFLEPDKKYKYKYLEAIRKVVG